MIPLRHNTSWNGSAKKEIWNEIKMQATAKIETKRINKLKNLEAEEVEEGETESFVEEKMSNDEQQNNNIEQK